MHLTTTGDIINNTFQNLFTITSTITNGMKEIVDYNLNELEYGEPRILSGNCFSVSSFISFILIALITGILNKKKRF